MARGKSRSKGAHGPNRLEVEEGGGEAWLTTYADAITLLMAFFMMLYAMSQIDEVKFKGLVAGFAEPFGNDTIGASAGKDNILPSGAGIVGDATTGQAGLASGPQDSPSAPDPFAALMQTLEQPIEVEFVPTPQFRSTDGMVDASGLPLLDLGQLAEVRDAIASALQAQGVESAIAFDLSSRGLIVSIAADDILFASGSTTMAAKGREVLARIAPVVAAFGNEIRIEGHTDDTPLNRGGYTNWNLSTDRAVAIVDVLAGEFGIESRRLSATGFGEHQPVVENDSATNRARNRRVEIVILAGGS